MAEEVQRLIAVLEARLDKYEKAFKKASSTGDAELARMEKRGAAFASNMNAATAKGAAGMQSFAKAAGVAKLQTANLAAQFQDIAVQLQGGSSPLTVALQQGTQIQAVLGPLGARGAVSALGAAFMSLLNPVSIATIGIIGLGGAALQYITSLVAGAEDSAEKLKEQAELIQKVADKWGEALPALRAYQQALNDAATSADILKAGNEAAIKQYDVIKGLLNESAAEFANAMLLLEQAGVPYDKIQALQTAWNGLNDKVRDGTATAEDAKAVQELLADTFNSTGIPAVDAMASALGGLIGMLAAASQAATNLRNETALLANQKTVLPTLGTVGPIFSGGGKFINEQQLMDIHAYDSKSQTQILAGKAAKKSGGGGGAAKQSPYASETEQITKKITALKAEAEALSGLNPLEADYAYQVEKAKIAAELLAKAQESGLKITPELKATIDALAASYAASTLEVQNLKDAQQDVLKSAQEWNDFSKSLLSGFISDLKSGTSAADALANALDKIANKLIDMALNSLFNGSGIGAFLAGLFGFAKGGVFAGGVVTPFAKGGVVNKPTLFPMANGAGLMGEAGPEAIMPLKRGADGKLGVRTNGGSGGGNTYSPTFNIDARGADQAAVARLERSLSEFARTEAKRIDARMDTRQVRKVRA